MKFQENGLSKSPIFRRFQCSTAFFLHFEHKKVLLELSEGQCSIVIMVNKLKYTATGIEKTHRSVLQESVTLLSGFYG